MTRLNRPGTGAAKADDGPSIERKAFVSYVRRGIERMEGIEAKALTVAVDATAGYLAPEAFGAEILKRLVEFSPVRAYARTVTIGASEIKYPRRVNSAGAFWVSETGARTGSEPSFEQVTIAPHELATYVDVSTALLEDNVYDLEGELALEFAEGFGKQEGVGFLAGTGAGQPRGLLSAAGLAEIKTGVAAGFSGTAPADVLLDMFHAIPTAYAQRGVWMMNRNTLSIVRKWKDGGANYLVLGPIAEGQPTTLLGRPIVEAVDMPNVAAGTLPIVFGDLQGYRIVDRINLSVLRDPYTLAAVGQVRIHARKRVGGDVTHPDRFVRLRVAV